MNRFPNVPTVVKTRNVILLAVLVLFGCGRHQTETTTTSQDKASPAEPTIELTDSQLNAIKIEPVGAYRFPVDKEAVGRVDCEEDLSIVQAESTLIGAAATLMVTSNELARAQELYTTNGVAKRELEQAISDQETAEAALKAAHDTVLALGITDAEMDHMITAGKIEPPLTPESVTNTSTKWLVANVIESDSPLVQVGQPVQFTVPAYPDRVFECKVSRTYAVVDPNAHRLEIRCEIADPKNELHLGMLANVVVRVHGPVEATAIPAKGVVREGDGTMTAWVTTDRHRFLQRIVKIGLQKDGMDQIVEGLQRGELVVTDGAIFLDNILQAPPSD